MPAGATTGPGAAGSTGTAGAAGTSIYGRTIDPYRMKAREKAAEAPPACRLIPVPRAGESIGGEKRVGEKVDSDEMADGNETGLSFTYQQQPIELNRDNLEPDNNSITGKVQAELSYENETWLLKDRSDLQTTFLAVAENTPLKDGDIILFGDRKFIFRLSANEPGSGSGSG